MNKLAILQSNYLPWKGVFDLINSVDIFVFLEDVQYTEHDWRNRNIIKTSQGNKWVIVPIKNSNRRGQLIIDAEIVANSPWQRKHYNSFKLNYAKAPYYKKYEWIIEELFINHKWTNLSELNIYATKLIANVLGIKTTFLSSQTLEAKGIKDDRIIDICKKTNSNYYITGSAAMSYIQPQKFIDESIKLEYINYEYPKYNQLNEPFNHYVSILDLIFNCGEEASYYIWGWRNDNSKIEIDRL